MDDNYSKPLKSTNKTSLGKKNYYLILHNDDLNTFDYVVDCLVNICKHDHIQAEQCTTIAHYKGKCEIKAGEMMSLKEMQKKLTYKGISSTIE